MDTRINTPDSDSSLFISPQELASRLGHADAPLLLDVRPQARFDTNTRMLMGAQRCPLDQVPAFAAALFVSNSQQKVVTYCVYGHHLSQEAAAVLRAAGLRARTLAGGFEGGEDGVDTAQDIAQWRSAGLPTVAKAKP